MHYNNKRYSHVLYVDKASVDKVDWYSNVEFSKISQMRVVQHKR